MGYYHKFPKYVSVAERRANTAKQVSSLKKKGITMNPVLIDGRTIAKTFWGKAWCDNLEAYSDYENRLPRGRTYVRNGSVIDLQVTQGKVCAQVMGSSLYDITVEITPMLESKWKSLIKTCAGKIDSLIELLKGKFSKAVMEIITAKDEGLFPKPQEIKMRCSCPDSAGMCKHIAAVLYGVGATLDHKPEWLFQLRCVNHADLISSAGAGITALQNQSTSQEGTTLLEDGDLSNLFGIEMEASKPTAPVLGAVTKKPEKEAAKKPSQSKPSQAKLSQSKQKKSKKVTKAAKVGKATEVAKAAKMRKTTKVMKVAKKPRNVIVSIQI